ncbi:protein translation factor SUI1 homolog [Capsicum annuum]|uniref:protein translation factor SUI1 homolog n=1 Tax=Capsicum annuum TaxID=4072 RepID=UPI001FB08BC5|nr:protein translation factor SUI1 homolog [Capsicum annuum]
MNRDSGPSFSLGICQLDNIKQYEEVVNFVPNVFDNEPDGFNQNRSKHRNDPFTMKKLREKHAKKTKKKVHVFKKRGFNSSEDKVPAKRRIVVEVICRDEPPNDKELGKVIQFQGSQRKNVSHFFVTVGVVKIHGF